MIVARGPLADKSVLAEVGLKPTGDWNQLDLVRLGNTFAVFVNGRFAGATTDLRWLKEKEEIEFPRKLFAGTLQCAGTMVRRVQIRDISALPPELFAPPFPFDARQAQEYQQLWANHMGRAVEETNSLGMKLRLIPPGEFIMGDKGYADSPPRTVRITRPYYIGTLEVTRKQYVAIIKDPTKIGNVEAAGDPEFPIGGVNWAEAVAFCEALSARPEERQAGRRYRLPTEAEWEYACRAGTKTRYSFGDVATDKDGNFRLDKDNASPLMKGGSFPANAWGLFDMHGNLREWCADWWDKEYPKSSPLNDPTGSSAGTQRECRGGGSNDPPIPTGHRFSQKPAVKYGDIGFRVVCEIVPPTLTGAFPPLDPAWEKAVAAMKPEQQIEAVKAELMKRNPGFDGKVAHKLDKDGVVNWIEFSTDRVADISPLRALPNLHRLDCSSTWIWNKKGPLTDLFPLKDMKKLWHLILPSMQVADLAPLKELSLWTLNVGNTQVTDLAPLKSMKQLNWLDCGDTKVTDLSPVKDLPVAFLWFYRTPVADLSPLQGMTTLKNLKFGGTKVAGLSL